MPGQLNDLDQALEAFQHLWRTRLRRAARESLGDGAGLRAFPLLGELIAHGPLSPTDLAQRLDLRTSTIAAHLDRLEEAGWAVRKGQGRKGVQVTATPLGIAAHQRFQSLRLGLLAEVCAPLAPAEMDLLQGLLARLAQGMLPGDAS